MNFDWSNYLKLSVMLYDKAYNNREDCFDNEAFYRCAISRSYYSVYCLARNYLKDKEGQDFSSDGHKQVRDYFIFHSKTEFKSIGNRLKMLHQDRKIADYENSFPSESPPKKAQKAVRLAEMVIHDLSIL
jgi:uncharacterized protein (UPF0332 family)